MLRSNNRRTGNKVAVGLVKAVAMNPGSAPNFTTIQTTPIDRGKLMKKYASALAIAGLLAAPAAHSAAAVDFNGEFEFNAYNVDLDQGGDDRRAAQQLLRLGANVKLDDGVQVVTRMNLSNRTWTGDVGAQAVPSEQFSPDAAGNVTLDLGYLQLPLGPGVLRVGRQESNWANCYVSCDDRRDRILYATRLGTTNIGFIYDKRQEFTVAGKDDFTGYSAYAVGKVGPMLAGLLIYHGRFDDNFPNPAQAGEDLTLVSPYFQGKFAGFTVDGAIGFQQQSFADNLKGAYLRAGYDLGVAKIDAQVLWSDGYRPNQGFDTFSSMINNSPENNNSPTSVARVGGDTLGFAARVVGNVTNQVKLVGAAGIYQDGDDSTFGTDTDLTFLDLQAHYQATKSTLIWATADRVQVDPPVGDKRDVDAFSLNIRTSF
jgi:hypothetical protein